MSEWWVMITPYHQMTGVCWQLCRACTITRYSKHTAVLPWVPKFIDTNCARVFLQWFFNFTYNLQVATRSVVKRTNSLNYSNWRVLQQCVLAWENLDILRGWSDPVSQVFLYEILSRLSCLPALYAASIDACWRAFAPVWSLQLTASFLGNRLYLRTSPSSLLIVRAKKMQCRCVCKMKAKRATAGWWL